MKQTLLLILTFSLFSFYTSQGQSPKMTEDWSSKPSKVTPAKWNKPPSDAIVLYRGKKDLDKWQKSDGEPAAWKPKCFKAIEVDKGNMITKQEFGDCQFHVEWRSPRKVDPEVEGQGRGNSGFYIMGLYEVQILDSYENETYYNGMAGSIYKQSAPLANATRRPGKWQKYDIIFHGPRFKEDGQLISPATLTVFHNGVLIQDHYELKGPTVYAGYPKYTVHPEKMPLLLQNHGNSVRFRNIWVREL